MKSKAKESKVKKKKKLNSKRGARILKNEKEVRSSKKVKK